MKPNVLFIYVIMQWPLFIYVRLMYIDLSAYKCNTNAWIIVACYVCFNDIYCVVTFMSLYHYIPYIMWLASYMLRAWFLDITPDECPCWNVKLISVFTHIIKIIIASWLCGFAVPADIDFLSITLCGENWKLWKKENIFQRKIVSC